MRFSNRRLLCLLWSCTLACVGTVWAADDPPKIEKGYLFLDLQSVANQKLDADFHGYKGNNLKPFPRGRQKFAGVEFEIGAKFIQLAGKLAPDFPEEVEAIPVGHDVETLHFLHATGWGSPNESDGTEIGWFTVHYDDKSTVKIPIEYGRDVRDWWDFDEQKPVTRGELAWKGENDASKNFRGMGIEIRVYKTSWVNPHREKKVVSIDYVSKNESNCAPFLIGISVEPPPDDADDVKALQERGAFLEFEPENRVRMVSLSAQGPVAGVDRGQDYCVDFLVNLPMLEKLYLNNSYVTDLGLERLAEINSLRWLSLNQTRITNAGLESLKSLHNLERLRLHGTSITDAGLEHLVPHANLKVLDLSQTRVTDEAVPYLSQLTALEEIDLRQTSLTDEGIDSLKKSLPNTRVKK